MAAPPSTLGSWWVPEGWGGHRGGAAPVPLRGGGHRRSPGGPPSLASRPVSGFEDPYLNERVPVSAALERVLQVSSRFGEASRFSLLDALAEQLGLRPDGLGVEAYQVLDRLREQLEEVLRPGGSGHWLTDLESHRPTRIAEAATEALDLTTAVEALRQLGWNRLRLSVTTVAEIRPGILEALSSQLATRVRRLLDQWRTLDAWNPAHRDT